jgi:hypothetical protein
MKTQTDLANDIQKDMEQMGYLAIPDFSKVGDLIDTKDYNLEQKKAYYQNLSKLALEQAFDEMINEFKNNKIK